MAESTPTAYTPNTLTGNLFSLGAFVCSFEGQPANRGRGAKRGNNVKVYKGEEAERCEEREESKQ